MPDALSIPDVQTGRQQLFNRQASDREAYLRSHPWVRHYEEGVPDLIDLPDESLTWILDDVAKSFPDQTAFIYYNTRITYARFFTLVHAFAIQLQRLGIQPGDRVALSLPNIPQYPIAFFAILKIGAVAVPTNPLYTEHELAHQLSDSGARILIMLDMFYPIVRNARSRIPVEHIIITSVTDYFSPILRALYPLTQLRSKPPSPKLTFKELRADPCLHLMKEMQARTTDSEVATFKPVPVKSDDLAVLQYTGGTTGIAKGAMLTHRNLLANTLQTTKWVPKGKEGQESAVCVAPFFHAYGMTVCMNLGIYAGATLILLPRFQPKEVARALRRYRPSMFPGIPTMYIAIMRELGKEKNLDFMQSIKYSISGAAPLPAQVQNDFNAMTQGKLVEGYGLSEAAPVTHCNPLTEKSRNGSIGLPLPNVEAAILNAETGDPLPIGEVGEIVVKGPNIMRGYWKREEETRALFTNGWMRTGDLGRMDEDGYFYVVERAKDMIIASGFNVYPREVEEVLFQHPAVEEAAVKGIADAYRGETVAAFIVLKDGYQPDEANKQSILAFCKQRLAAYKMPKMLEFRDELPKSLVGKVLRRKLQVE
ncbi:long-chain-fatty-acid--CoA ligase [Ktedonobacter racemifer]|uniref:long-chain-fatty-acid--CoA ligase n=1 Tax=Ktedonobacter racemifer TaxID=363277 RepID=UPI000A06F4A8|nr:long-chain fatty acid--CoA ligase [Ktedonobacter racemifer]